MKPRNKQHPNCHYRKASRVENAYSVTYSVDNNKHRVLVWRDENLETASKLLAKEL